MPAHLVVHYSHFYYLFVVFNSLQRRNDLVNLTGIGTKCLLWRCLRPRTDAFLDSFHFIYGFINLVFCIFSTFISISLNQNMDLILVFFVYSVINVRVYRVS
jgi:hypothetical protein